MANPQFGLSLILYTAPKNAPKEELEDETFTAGSHTASSEGIRVVLHEPGTHPPISEHGIDLHPGTLSIQFILYPRPLSTGNLEIMTDQN